MALPDYLYPVYNINNAYKSIIPYTDIPYPEPKDNIKKRIKKVFCSIMKKYKNKNVIIVTHQCICTALLELIINTKSFNKAIDTYNIFHYPMGMLTKIVNNNVLDFEILHS